jgi:uncharacterized DUF497 family protein
VWNPSKARTNIAKHGVTSEEAATVLADPLAIVMDDPDHSAEEQRFLTVGLSHRQRALVVSYVDRGEQVRIISAREATRGERLTYEEGE